MALDGAFDTIEAYYQLLDRLERESLVPGMNIACWATLIPRNRLRILPSFAKEQLPITLPKDHPSVVHSYFSLDDPVIRAIVDIPSTIKPDSSYRVVPSGTAEEVIEALRTSQCFKTPDPSIRLSSKISALIELKAPHLNNIISRTTILNSIGLPSIAYEARDSLVNITPTGYQAAPHVDLMEVVIATGTAIKLWVFYKTPAAGVNDAVRLTRDVAEYTIETIRKLISSWSSGSFYILLQKPGDLVVVPSGWWHWVETLSGGILAGVETFIAQGFNLHQNIAHLETDFLFFIPMPPNSIESPFLNFSEASNTTSIAQEEVEIAVSFFCKMVNYTCELLQQDTAPWRSFTSITNTLKPLKRMVIKIADRFQHSILSFTYVKSYCNKLRAAMERLGRAMKAVIKKAQSVLNDQGLCRALRGCKWKRCNNKSQSWVDHCLASERHFPFAVLVTALNDAIASKEEEKDKRLTESRREREKKRKTSAALALPPRKSRRLLPSEEGNRGGTDRV